MKILKYISIFILTVIGIIGIIILNILLSPVQKITELVKTPFNISLSVGIFTFILLTVIFKIRILYSTIISALIPIIMFLFIVENRSKTLMCAEVKRLGGVEFKRNSFLWSVWNTPEEYQFELHAKTLIQNELHGWSYHEKTFYKIPINAVDNVGVSNKNKVICPYHPTNHP